VSLTIAKGGTLADLNYNPLKFWASSISIKVQGFMDVWYGPNASNTPIDINGNTKDYIDVTGTSGVLTYVGQKGVVDTFKNVPVMVENGGTFSVKGGSLVVQGNVNGTVPNISNNASVYVKDTGSTVQLSSLATLECDSDYYQASGTLETVDVTVCNLFDGVNGSGTATIAGGFLFIALDGNPFDYGTFFIGCKQLNFGGTYHPKIAGNNSGAATHDTLDLTSGNGATLNLQGSSALDVTVNNQPVAGQKYSWPIIYAGSFTNNQFNTTGSNPNTPGLKYGPAQATEYDLTYGT
jgi:hypothetical protein